MSPDKGKRSKGSHKAAPKKLDEARPANGDPGPPYAVLWHPDALDERDASWPPDEKVAMANAVQKLVATGPRLPYPHSSAIQGAAGQGLRELRPRGGHSRWRPIYRQLGPGTFVILAVGREAQIDRGNFDAAVVRAAQRFAGLDAA